MLRDRHFLRDLAVLERCVNKLPHSHILTVFVAIAAGGVTSVMKASLNFALASGA